MKALNEEEDFAIPMTPMIDIVFQLLIFFLLASTVAEEERDIKIRLPQGSQGDSRGLSAGSRLMIGVRQDGSVTLGGQALELPELRKRLIDAGRSKEKPGVVIRWDKKAYVEIAAEVLQYCKEAGLESVSIAYYHDER
jgi:biopolymer transport protein ExbD